MDNSIRNVSPQKFEASDLVDANRFEVPRVVVEVPCRTVGHRIREFS